MSENIPSISEMREKRYQRWQERHDLNYDKIIRDSYAYIILSSEELKQQIYDRPYLLIELVFLIVDKDKETVPFFFNDVQKDFIQKLETKGTNKPFFILKGRQQGFTSLITAIQLSYAIVRKNFSGFTIADRSDNTSAIFNDKAKTTYDRLPDVLKPQEKFNNSRELFFNVLNSSWRISTATDEVGRSRTLNFVHYSEVAFFECELANLQKSIGEACTHNAFVVYETTANGFNDAKNLWDSNTCVNIFYEWWKTKEYQSDEYQYLDTNDGWLLNRIEFLKEKGLSKEQITWYAKKYSSYLDKSSIRQEYPCTPEEAFISSNTSMFNAEKITQRLNNLSLEHDYKVGYFEFNKRFEAVKSNGKTITYKTIIEDIRFVESKSGFIKLHSDVRTIKDKKGEPFKKCPYVIGGDTSGNGKDYYTAKVLDNTNSKTVATLRKQRMTDEEYAEQVYCLGKYYNDALIGIEINYSRVPMRILQDYEYPNLYLRERVDGISDETVLELGFQTSSKTKPIIIQELISNINEEPKLECDIDTLKEMLVFVKKDNGKMEALDGYHDDLVMALAIAHFIRRSFTSDYLDVEKEKDTFIEDNFNFRPQGGGNNSYGGFYEL